ncbi:Mesoderm development candidate 1-like [Oopsacas minuta]|uniref:Mesoderm development candidate 1-like n=1 Tax=Oopsacas minuta TaxID=111878 RepID=A0AAV7JS80_9METZ|nr:Mesoderm development candidate 1-like [Oopsacas minuta]
MSIYEESALEIQLTAELLLLRGGKRAELLGPVASVFSSLSRCLDSAIANSKTLLISIQSVLDFLRSSHVSGSYNKREQARIVDLLTSSAIYLIEHSAHAAYHVGVRSSGSKRAVMGVIDLYRISKARYLVNRCIRQLTEGETSEDGVGILATGISRCVAENVCVFVRTCSRAAEHELVPSNKREQLGLLAQSIQACSASFLTSLKSLCSEKDGHICILFSRPLLAALDTCIDYLVEAGDVLLGQPAQLSAEGQNIQLKILGIAMSVVSGCAKFLSTAAKLESKEVKDNRWHQLLKCQIAVTDSSNMLTSLLQDQAPSPAKNIQHKSQNSQIKALY